MPCVFTVAIWNHWTHPDKTPKRNLAWKTVNYNRQDLADKR